MKVKELIEELLKIEDKEIDVEIAVDYNISEIGIEDIETTDRMIVKMNCVRLIPEAVLLTENFS